MYKNNTIAPIAARLKTTIAKVRQKRVFLSVTAFSGRGAISCSFSLRDSTTAVFCAFSDVVSATVSRPRVRIMSCFVSTISPDAVSRSMNIISCMNSVSRVRPVMAVADRATAATLSNERRSTTCCRCAQPDNMSNNIVNNIFRITKRRQVYTRRPTMTKLSLQ